MIRKDVLPAQGRNPLVQRRYAGKAAPQHDRIGIDQVDHRSQPAGEPVHVAIEGRATLRVSTLGKISDLERAQAMPGITMMIRRESRPRKKGLDTARAPAIARRSRALVRRRPGQWVVAPFSGDRVGADEDPPCQGDAPSDPGAENDAEDRLHPCRSAVGCFRQSKAIGVVGQPNWPPECGLKISLQRAADQPRGVGVLYQSGDRRNRPRYADPNGRRFADLQFDHLDESGDHFYRCAIISRGRRNAPADANSAETVNGSRFDLSAAKIYADAKSGCHQLCTVLGLGKRPVTDC